MPNVLTAGAGEPSITGISVAENPAGDTATDGDASQPVRPSDGATRREHRKIESWLDELVPAPTNGEEPAATNGEEPAATNGEELGPAPIDDEELGPAPTNGEDPEETTAIPTRRHPDPDTT